jgi:hypothetical protein
VDPPIIHEGHGGPGETSQLTTQLNVQFYPQSVWAGGCGGLVNLIQPVSGPIAAVPVEWHLGSDLTAHGTLAVPAGGSRTDENGRAS